MTPYPVEIPVRTCTSIMRRLNQANEIVSRSKMAINSHVIYDSAATCRSVSEQRLVNVNSGHVKVIDVRQTIT